jgi:hypothetical protein
MYTFQGQFNDYYHHRKEKSFFPIQNDFGKKYKKKTFFFPSLFVLKKLILE